jgi:hypothetical protein
MSMGWWTGGALSPSWTGMEAAAKAHRRSRAWDLTMAARGATDGDGDPYPGWHEAVEGLGRPGIGEGRRGGASLMRRCSTRVGEGGGERRVRCGEAEMGAPFIGSRW